jgi:hypothetical protein
MVTVVPKHPCTHELAGVFARYKVNRCFPVRHECDRKN